MKEALLEIKNLSAWYQKERPVLSELSLGLRAHEAVGLIGLNGAGKTTLLKVLSGLHGGFRQEGAWFHGQALRYRDNGFKRSRYTVFAEDHSFGYFTFWEYLSYVSAAYRRKTPKERTDELIEGFHFQEYQDMLLKELSTGNQKKAFLITAFALEPELLFLDEPVNGLDFQSTEFLYGLIARYKERGTVLFASHILESLTLTADRVLVLERGRIRREFGGDQMDPEQIRAALHGTKGEVARHEAWQKA